MQNYLGSKCPYCLEKFTAEDDIVVCPECGTPHHRNCYFEHSACANEAKHSEDFEWKGAFAPHTPKHPAEAEHRHEAETLTGNDSAESEKTRRCINCGNENPADLHYCLFCGAKLYYEEAENSSNPEEEFQRERERIFTEAFGSEMGGISPKEAAIYVRSNAGYFLPRFAAFNKGAKFDTNFSAFIFSYFYLFYRKMYGLGAAVLGVSLLLGIPGMLLDLAAIQQEYVDLGMLSQIIWEIPHQDSLAIYAVIANLLIWVMRIALMMFFNRIYFSKITNTIKSAREKLLNESEENIRRFFYSKGGTNIVLPIIVALLAFSVTFILAGAIINSGYFIMPELSEFL